MCWILVTWTLRRVAPHSTKNSGNKAFNVALRFLKLEDIYAAAHKDVSEREAPNRLNKGDKTTVTYTHRPSNNKTAVTLAPPHPLTPPSTPWVTLTPGEENGRPQA